MKRKFSSQHANQLFYSIILLTITCFVLTSLALSTAKVYAGEINFKRCKEKGDYNLRAVIQDNNIDLTTSIGQVLTTVEMEGGSWDFTCDSQSNHATFDRNMYIGTGNHTWSTPWSYDSTVCIIPGLSGIGIRFYTSSGSPKVCNISVPNGGGQIVKFDSGTVLSGTASYSPFAELIRIGDINAGKHVLPSTMPIAQKLRTASNGYSFDNKTFKLVFTNPTLEAHLCTMVQFNQTIDFGSGIARGDEVISKPFDVWLTDCSGEALTEYKNSAKLTFASSPGRISPDGTQLYNCNDDDCADGAYITFTDIEGDAVDLKTGYRLNAQTTDNDYKLSFSSNLHTENTTGGKIDTSLTLVINYL